MDFDELMAAAEEERRKGYAAADAEYALSVAAIKKIKELVARQHPIEAPPAADAAPLAQEAPSAEWPGLRNAIRQIIARRAIAFDLDDILTAIQSHYNLKPKRVQISSELWRLNRSGEIEIFAPGSGSRPNLYMREGVLPQQQLIGGERSAK